MAYLLISISIIITILFLISIRNTEPVSQNTIINTNDWRNKLHSGLPVRARNKMLEMLKSRVDNSFSQINWLRYQRINQYNQHNSYEKYDLIHKAFDTSELMREYFANAYDLSRTVDYDVFTSALEYIMDKTTEGINKNDIIANKDNLIDISSSLFKDSFSIVL